MDPDPTPSPDPSPSPVGPDNPDEPAHYADGSYTAYAYCADTDRPDRYDPYYVALTVTVKDGAVAGISDIHGSATGNAGDAVLAPYNADDNDVYLGYAKDGRTRKGVEYVGVVNQLLKGTASSAVTVVSGATYSSRAIAKAYDAALEQAAAAYKEQQASGDAGSGGADGGDSGNGAGARGGSGGQSGANASSTSLAKAGADV